MARQSGSILAADFGSVYTRAVLIDIVDGVYRLVARADGRTSTDFPVGDVSIGFQRVVQELAHVTGRRLVADDGQVITPEQPDRSGVDYFIASASTGRPLRTVLIGLVPEVSIASSLRAAAGTYIQIVETISLDENRTEEQQLNAILDSRPNLIFIAGGTEGGAQEPVLQLARVAQLSIHLVQAGGRKPFVLYAGNSALEPKIRALFDGLTALFVAANVRPTLEIEDLESAQLQLAQAYDDFDAARGGGYDTVGEMSRLGIFPTGQSYTIVTDFLGKTLPVEGVLLLDIGSATSVLAASLQGRVHTTIRTDIGQGHSAIEMLELVGADAVRRWLPFYTTHNELREYALNKTLRPATVPETLRDLYLEHALLRAGIASLLTAARPAWSEEVEAVTEGLMPPIGRIIAAGSSLTRTGHPGHTALLLLDALQPVGVTELMADPYGIVAGLGALAHVNPEAVVQVLDSTALERIGTVFNLGGQPVFGRTALKIKITTEDKQVTKHEVLAGHLWVFPLPAGKHAHIEVSAARRGLSIGKKSKIKMTVEGGTTGLIFDARGRGLPYEPNIQLRANQMPMWVSEITGTPPIEIDEKWLVEIKETLVDSAEQKAVAKPRRGKPAKPSGKERKGRKADQDKPIDSLADLMGERDEEEDNDFANELDELRR